MAWFVRHYDFMKKLTPYIISYLIITSGLVVYAHVSRHTNIGPYFVLHSTLSLDDLSAKLQQVGISNPSLHLSEVKPAHLATLVYTFVFYGVIFAAFVGLTLLFKRVFRTTITNHDHAA